MTFTLSPLRHKTIMSRRRLSSFDEHLPVQEDFRNLYMGDRKPSCGSNRSLASLNTDDGASSTCTERISNTVGAREKRQKERCRFRSFTKVLMIFLEKKNPTVCKNARNVILQYKAKRKKNKGQPYSCGEEEGSETMCESIKVPLKETVGSAYWRQAKGYLNQMEQASAAEQHSNGTERTVLCGDGDFEPLSLDSSTNHFTDSQAEVLSRFFSHDNNSQQCKRPSKRSRSSNENQLAEERKLRKQRFWMLVRVLMRDVEENDSELYKKARTVVEECARRNVNKEERFVDLIASVQRELKRAVGIAYWKRAKRHVAKHLLKKAYEKVYEDALAKEASSFRSLEDDFAPLLVQTQSMSSCSLQQAAFTPPKYNPAGWRDTSIPTNAAIPTKRSREEEWTTSPYAAQC